MFREPLHVPRRLVSILAILAGASDAGAVPTDWNNATGGNWNDSTKWTPNNVPDALGESARIPNGIGSPTVTLNISPTIDSATIDATGAILNLNSGTTLTLNDAAGLTNSGTINANVGTCGISGVITNSGAINVLSASTFTLTSATVSDTGTITINSNGGGSATSLSLATSTALSGGGQIVLNLPSTNTILAQLNSSVGAILTQASAHTIRGQGQINAALTNNGTLSADVSGRTLLLQTNSKTNNNIFKATNGGFLDISGITITQGLAGQITADGGTVRLQGGATISGGTLATANSGTIENTSGTNTLSSVTNSGTFNILSATTTSIDTALANNGTITINSNGGGSATILNAASNTALSGSGQILLNLPSTNTLLAQLNSSVGATVTQDAAHTIHGQGQINAALVNNGTVTADVSGRSLLLQNNNKTNNNILNATGGAFLDIAGITVTQGASGQIIADASKVRLTGGATVSGGILTTTNLGSIENTISSNTLSGVTNNGVFNILSAGTTTVDTGLTNNGTITINSNSGGSATILNFSTDVNLSGSGQTALNLPTSNTSLAQLNTGLGVTLTQSAAHTIHGQGQINAALINNGTINADVNGRTLLLQTNNQTNNNIVKSTGGGTLDINAITLTQGSSGQLVGDGGIVRLLSATVSGGTLNTINAGVIQSATGASTLTDVTNTGTLQVLTATTVQVNGGLVNNGAITVNPTAGGSQASLSFSPGATFTGTGDLTINATVGNNTLGLVTANQVRQNSLTVAGRLTINANGGASGVSKVATLSITGAGKIDLSDNDLVIDTATLSTVRGWIITGRSGGSWAGNGITSSAAAAASTAKGLGYAAGNDPRIAALNHVLTGQSFTDASVVVKYTYIGDANLDGSVDGSDVALWAQNFSGALGVNPPNSRLWTQGDWNYDGSVDGSDVALWAQNFTGALGGGGLGSVTESLSGLQLAADLTPQAIPEPGGAILLVAGGILGMPRRSWRGRQAL